MQSFTILFLIMLALSTIMRFWLSSRQIQHVEAKRDSVPDSFAGKITLEEHQKAADYTTVKTRFGRLPLAYEVILLLVWTLGGGLEWLDQTVLSYSLIR